MIKALMIVGTFESQFTSTPPQPADAVLARPRAVECRPTTVNTGNYILRFQMFKLQVVDTTNLLDSLGFWLIT